MSGEDRETVEYARRRLIQMGEWREILSSGTDAEKQALIASLRDIDLAPLFSVLDQDPEEVRAEAARHRRVLALAELERMTDEAIRDGDFDLAASYLDLRLNAEGEVD